MVKTAANLGSIGFKTGQASARRFWNVGAQCGVDGSTQA